MDKVEQVAIMQACANANPSAQRGGYWDDADQPVTGWVPMLGDMRVSCPDSKRFVFGSEAHAIDAARRFRDRCRKNLVDIGLADDIDGALYVHRDLGPDFVHISSGYCGCEPEVTFSDDTDYYEQEFRQ